MGILKIDDTKDYSAVQSLRDGSVSLKAKGVLTQMLAMPDDWDYSNASIARFNRVGAEKVRSALRELEQAGYLSRDFIRDNKGKMVEIQYTVYDKPYKIPLGKDLSLEELGLFALISDLSNTQDYCTFAQLVNSAKDSYGKIKNILCQLDIKGYITVHNHFTAVEVAKNEQN